MNSIRVFLGVSLLTLAVGASAAVQSPKQVLIAPAPVSVSEVQEQLGALATDQAFHTKRFKKATEVAVGDWYCKKMDWRCNEYGDQGACAMYEKYCTGGA